VTVVVPVHARRLLDITARTVSAKLQESLGQTVRDRTTSRGQRRPRRQVRGERQPDGYTLFVGSIGVFADQPGRSTRTWATTRRRTSTCSRSPVPHAERARDLAQLPGEQRRGIHRLPEEEPGQGLVRIVGHGLFDHLTAALFWQKTGTTASTCRTRAERGPPRLIAGNVDASSRTSARSRST
jgi:hypothetical protein